MMHRGGLDMIAALPNERATQGNKVARRLVSYVRPYWKQLLVVLVLVLIAAACQALAPFLIGYAIDTAISRADGARLNWLMLVLLFVYVGGVLAMRAQIVMIGVLGQRILARMRTEIFGTVQRLSLRFFDRHPAGDLMSRLTNDTDVLNQLFSQGIIQSLGSLFGLIGILIAMLVLDWRLALVSFAVIPVMLVITRVFAQLSRRAFRRTRESLGDVSSEIQEEIAGVKVAQAFSRTAVNQQRFQQRNAANRDANVNATAISSAFTPAIDVLSTIATAIVAGYGGYLALQGLVTVGVVVAFLTYVQQFFRPIQALSTFYTTAQASLAAAERIFDLLDTPVDLSDSPGAGAMPPIEGRVVFDHVSFSYGQRPTDGREPRTTQRVPDREPGIPSIARLQGRAGANQPPVTGNGGLHKHGPQPVSGHANLHAHSQALIQNPQPALSEANGSESENQLEDVSLVAEPGQTVAIVGPTGAGKTTLVNMIGRFYDVDAGAVTIDGVDVRDATRASLRAQMGVVLQDSFLFAGTVAENIRYGRLEATDDEIEAAARAANAHDFITRLPEGYQTKIGERGGTLSQGQRQLIGIARAILAAPRILILDEATSSVDTRTEALIQSALRTLLKGRTSFVIAHRLSTIRDADQVLVMQAGRIIERGTHADLLARGGAYAELYRRQFRDETALASV